MFAVYGRSLNPNERCACHARGRSRTSFLRPSDPQLLQASGHAALYMQLPACDAGQRRTSKQLIARMAGARWHVNHKS